MGIGRALGLMAAGAAQGYGQGVIEQAKMNWQRMISDESEARADKRSLDSDTRQTKASTDAAAALAGTNATAAEIKAKATLLSQGETNALAERDLKARTDRNRLQDESNDAFRDRQQDSTEEYRAGQTANRAAQLQVALRTAGVNYDAKVAAAVKDFEQLYITGLGTEDGVSIGPEEIPDKLLLVYKGLMVAMPDVAKVYAEQHGLDVPDEAPDHGQGIGAVTATNPNAAIGLGNQSAQPTIMDAPANGLGGTPAPPPSAAPPTPEQQQAMDRIRQEYEAGTITQEEALRRLNLATGNQ